MGGAVASARDRRDRCGQVRRRDHPAEGRSSSTARWSTSASTSIPRRDTTVEKLAGLKVLHPEIEGFSITAGNSSGTNDAAAAVALVEQ